MPRRVSEATKAKISASMKGLTRSAEHKAKISAAQARRISIRPHIMQAIDNHLAFHFAETESFPSRGEAINFILEDCLSLHTENHAQ